ncbi:MAG: hypothetical protein RL087_1362, partial [Pseudomonadota bacterium]
MEVALGRLVLREGGLLAQVEHQVEGFFHRLAFALGAGEVDRPGRLAHTDAFAVAAAGLQVDAVVGADRALGAGRQAGVAARAQVQVDRVVGHPGGLEGAEPAAEGGELRVVGGVLVRLGQGAAGAVQQQAEFET